MAVTGLYMTTYVRRAQNAIEVFQQYAVKETLSLYSGLEERADKIADDEFERLGSEPAGEDCDGDMSVFAEIAQEKGIAFYETMTGLRQGILNLLASGLFHLVEQHLADLCRDGAITIEPPADTKLDVVADWYKEHFGLDLRTLSAWNTLDELRLVANTVKHGEGSSARQLRRRRPELFVHPDVARFTNLAFGTTNRPVRLPLGGDDVYVTEQLLHLYCETASSVLGDITKHFEANADEYFG